MINKYEKKVHVICNKCELEFQEDDIKEVTGIAENEMGQDVLSFKCPKCNKYTKSLRYG